MPLGQVTNRKAPPPPKLPGEPLKLPHEHPKLPPHRKKSGKLIWAIITGSVATAFVGFFLNLFNIPINVILPVLAPIWVGSITLIYSVNKEH
ncbi:hypothetical protein KKI23_03185 [Patescibacteria group bacterium]|nr:hypothetical protein [Patescibacteria group bacterium]